MSAEDDDIFDLVANALIWQLSVPDSKRSLGSARQQHILAASAKVLYQTVARMLAIATPHRFPAYMYIVFLLACDSVDNCEYSIIFDFPNNLEKLIVFTMYRILLHYI